MRRAIFAILFALQFSPAVAFWQSRDSNYNVSIVTGGGGGFTGPGDVVSGAKGWWGLRAYSAADRGNRLINACHSTAGADDGCLDLSSDATTGNLVAAVVDGTHVCPGAGCNVKIMYDRSGALNCSGSACDVTEASVSQRPALTASCIGSLPCLVSSTGFTDALKTLTGFNAVAQPLTFSFVFNLTSAANSGDIMTCRQGSVFATTDTTPTFNNFAGSNFNIALTTATWYANQSIFNNTSSIMYLNGTSNSGTTGTNSCIANDVIWLGWDSFNGSSSSKTTEYGIWSGGFNATQQANMNANQRTYWGF